jgi:tetratricopeptide (TPR) repeat protein
MRRAAQTPLALIAILAGTFAASACRERPEVRFARMFQDANLALRDGQLTRGLDISNQALGETGSQPDSDWAWKFRLLNAELFIARLDIPRALPILDASVPAGVRFDSLRGRQQYLRARASLAGGHLKPALDALERAVALAPSDRDLQLDTVVLAGQIRMRLGLWPEAESSLNALVTEAARTGDLYRQALALNNLGMGYLVRSRFDEALSRFERIFGLAGLDQTTVYATALYNAGICYARLGQFDRAVTLQRRAIALQDKAERRREFEQAVGELGSTYLLQEDFDRGLPYLQQALSISRQAGLTADAALWARNLAAAYVYLGKWDEAEKYNLEARRLNPPDRPGGLAFSTLHDGHIAAGRGRDDEAVRLFEEAVASAESEPAVRWSAHDGLAQAAVRAGQPARAAQQFEAALGIIEKTRADLLKTDYKLSFLSGLMQFYQDYVNALVDRGQVERALEVADSSRGRVLAEQYGVAAPVDARAASFVRLARESKAVLLFYWLGNTRSHLFIVTPGGVKRADLPPARDIEALVGAYDATIQQPLAGGLTARDATAGEQLYRVVVEPAAPFIPPNASVVIVPDGALHRLNFETLPVRGSPHRFWIEDVDVQVAPSLTLLTFPKRSVTADRSLLLMGNPTPREPDFPALGYAPGEMAAIAKYFPPARVTAYQGSSASPAAYLAAGPDRFSMIHFTAHATANLDIPLDSAVILSGPDTGFKLYARDVASSPLHAELVTVSACKSAGNRAYSGEGLVGFAWAFLRAGAKRVVAGLWDVDDRSTAELMDRFYESLSHGDSPAHALRQAKLWLMSRGGNDAKPYYWGAFQIFTLSP